MLTAVGLSACSDDGGGVTENKSADVDDDGDVSAEEVLALARTTFDETSGVSLSLTTDDLPDGVDGLVNAEGVATHAPAFEGVATVSLSGSPFNVDPLVAVDGKVFASIPGVPITQEIDPAEYGAPDPAQLMDPEEGFSSILTETENVEEGETVRGGENNEEVLTEYTGTVAGSVVENIIPSAEGDFDVTYTVAENGELREAKLTGVFYPDSDEMTYTVTTSTTTGRRRTSRSSRERSRGVACRPSRLAADPGRRRGRVRRRRHLRRRAGAARHARRGGLSTEELQRAAPIVSGFLLGYVAMLPLIGRIADLRGRVPVLVAALVIFALGSLVTALAYDMPSMVAGRFLQGLGGGGLVPATLALVADLYPVQRRGVPLGIVSAVQEIGSVIGPLFGALVLAVADWRAIFLINLAVGLVLAVAISHAAVWSPTAGNRRESRRSGPTAGSRTARRRPAAPHRPGRRRARLHPPGRPAARPDLGPAVHPVRRRRPLADADRRGGDGGGSAVPGPVRHRAPAAGRPAQLGGGACARPTCSAPLSSRVALGGMILAFATADPEVAEFFADQGWWYLLGASRSPRRVRRPPPAAREPAAGAARGAAAHARLGLARWSASSSEPR